MNASKAIPLLSHPRPETVVARRRGVDIDRRRMLAHAAGLAAAFPAGRHYLNNCGDRYHFAVTLLAGMMSGRVALLPSTFNASVAAQLADFAPDAFVVGDGGEQVGALPWLAFPQALPAGDAGDDQVPAIDPQQLVAWVFTSGSTGSPVPHAKHWGKLVLDVRNEAAALGVDSTPGFTLIGTVPAQHMYGLESTVLMALLCNGVIAAERPFFPPEVSALLAATPRPRVLVTTPFHLRNLLSAEAAPPPADLLVSATAPLEQALAAQAEAAFGCQLLEIFGCTETGQFATRRCVGDEPWTPFPGVVLEDRDGTTWAHGGHIESAQPLGDIIVPAGEGRFRLGGRNADLVNIAGKRSSVAYLSQQLCAIPGVRDGAFFMPDPGQREVVRPAAFAVADDLDATAVRRALAERIDAVFLPRPLVMLDALPRNATGKLPRETCQALLEAHFAERRA